MKRIYYLIKYLSWIHPKTKIGKNCRIGPFAHIRENVILGDRVWILNFAEIKNSKIGGGTHMCHHSYIGDSDVGKNVIIGAGAITCNFDGKIKSRTTIKNNAFIGSNSNLIAPVTIGENAYVAAGSTITEDVPPYALAIARARQVNKLNYIK